MKKIAAAILVTAVLVSCKGKTDDTKVLSAKEDAEMKEFLQWKAGKAQPEAGTEKNTAQKTVVVAPAPAVTPAPVRKKGWSKAAKGAVIGTGTGALAGAIINKKNRAAGAVIGGVAGAGVGYGIGRSQDKKDGRY